MADTFYITTPIYYVNARPHLGHAYTTFLTDTIARYKKLSGCDVRFLTGTDEHGQKIAESAAKLGKSPQELVDEVSGAFQDAWARMNIQPDDFIRTTQERHKKAVQALTQKLFDKGDIYKSEYEGWYCTPCETFWTEGQLLEGKLCPECKRETGILKEESYFFRMSAYQDRLLEHYRANPDFVVPESKRNEIVSRIEKEGLNDVSVSRTSVAWGIPAPFDPNHTIYVWFDALLNYISALGYSSDDDSLFKKYWPAVHAIGKDILWFHGAIWPCALMALEIPLYKHLLVHGFWLQGEEKMSKSKGNAINPIDVAEQYGVDPVRYFLMREMTLGLDQQISLSSVLQKYNTDLANDWGNLVHRTLTQIQKFCDGRIPDCAPDEVWQKNCMAAIDLAVLQFEKFNIKGGLDEIWVLIRNLNGYVQETQPWALAKTDMDACHKVLKTVIECIRSVAIMTLPVLPETSPKVFQKLGIEKAPGAMRVEDARTWGAMDGAAVDRGEPLFGRIDLEALQKET